MLDAISRGDVGIVKQLLRYGANPALRNNAGYDCFETAREKASNKPEILQCLSMHSLASSGTGNTLNAQSKNASPSLQSLLSFDETASINGGFNDNNNKTPRQVKILKYFVLNFTTIFFFSTPSAPVIRCPTKRSIGNRLTSSVHCRHRLQVRAKINNDRR